MDYHQPSAPWERVGLSVRNKFNDDGWIGMDGNPNEWAVAFHGVRDPTGYALPRIVPGGLIPGQGPGYAGSKCVRTGLIIGNGIYCSPKIDIPL